MKEVNMTRDEIVFTALAYLCAVGLLTILVLVPQLIANLIKRKKEKARDKIEWLNFNGKLGRKQLLKILKVTTYTKIRITIGRKKNYLLRVDPRERHIELYFFDGSDACYVTLVPKTLFLDEKLEGANAWSLLVLIEDTQRRAGYVHKSAAPN